MKKIFTLFYVIIFFLFIHNNIYSQWNIIGKLTSNTINSTFYLNGNNIWAVGDNALIMKYDGTKWIKYDLPFITNSNLKSVYFLYDTLGWAVGEGGLILKYSASKWRIETVYTSGDFNSVYFSDKSHGWAFGNGVYKYDGTKWTSVDIGIGYFYFYSTFFLNANNGWAVTGNGSILKYNGSTWTIEATGLNNLRTIYMTSTSDGWAAGYGVVYHYSGTTWSSVSIPSQYVYSQIYSIKMINSNLGWMVGSGNCVLRYNGSAWLNDATMDYTHYSDFYSICMKNDALDGVITGINGLICRYNGSKWTANQTNDYKYYSSLDFVDKNHGWISKSDVIMKYLYGKLTKDSINNYSFYINSINMLDTMHGLAVGSSDKYLQYNGRIWEQKSFSNTSNSYYLTDVQYVDSLNIWAVGRDGLILKYSGKQWIEQPKITTKYLRSVFFVDSLHGWAVGDSGAILKYEEKKWTIINSGITENLLSVAFSDNSNGWAVGASEIILHYNGSLWYEYKKGNVWNSYNSVKFINNKWWISGYNKLLKFDGRVWAEDYLNIGGWNSFVDVDFSDINNGWIISPYNIYNTTNGGKLDYSGVKSISVAGKINYPNVWSFDTVMVLHDVMMNEYLTIRPLTENGVNIIFKDNYNFSARKGFSAFGSRTFRLPLSGGTSLPGGTIGKGGIIIIPPIKLPTIYPVIFKALDSTGGKGWGTFSAYPDADDPLDTIRMSYCYFYASRAYVAASLNNAGVVMNNCLFQENNGGVSLNGVKSGYIINSKFENAKNYYLGLEIKNSSNLSITSNTFKNNYTGVTSDNASAVVFDKNTFVNNRNSGLLINNSTVTIKNSTIFNNNKSGFQLSDSRVDLYNSVIANNFTSGSGGGIYSNNSILNIVNSTIVNNKCGVNGAGIYYRFSNGDVYNSIIWNNKTFSETNQIGLYNLGSKPNFYYCDLEGGPTAFKKDDVFNYAGKCYYYINVLPVFVNASVGAGLDYDGVAANWRLQESSPCINKGTQLIGNLDFPDYDLDSRKRILNGEVDMGAYETPLPSFTAPCTTINSSTVWAADTVKVNCNLTINPSGSLKIMPGTRVLFMGRYKIIVKGKLIAVGTKVDSVRFTINDTSKFFTNDTSKGWRGIEFDNYTGDMDNSDSSLFKFCKFEYGKYVMNSTDMDKGIFGLIRAVNFKKIEISNSLLINNIITDPQNYMQASLIYLSRSGIKLTDNKIISNNGSVFGFNMSDVLVNNNIIYSNKYLKQYRSMLNINGCEANISNNIVSNNSVTIGATINFASSNGLINNNIFANNSSDSSCYYGTIEANSSNVIIANNTVVNNYNYGMNIFNSKAKVINNLIWGNTYGFNLSSPGIGSIVSNCNFDTHYGNAEYFVDNVTDTPRFILPSAGRGKAYNGYIADWRVTQFSPCINKGYSDTAGLKLFSFDIAGKKRVNGERIDIGAYEDQGGRLYIKSQPANIIACNGGTAEFSLEPSDTAFMQWQKNGVNIPGATSRKLKIAPVNSADEANYSCNVSNAYGTIQTSNVYLTIRTAPRIISNLEDAFIGKSRKAALNIEATGSEPITYQWYKDNILMSNQNFALLKFDNITMDDEAKYFVKLSNTCGEIRSDTASLTIVPQICMVSVSKNSNYNLVVWEKNSKQIFDHYNIYREGTVSGFYQKIGETPFNSGNIFEDRLVNPKSQAFLYKITGVYSNGTETDIEDCSPHKTIHLLITEGVPQGYQLDWDEYIGFPYGTYNIYKIVGKSDTSLVHSMASTTRTWTDVNETKDTVYYFVSVQKSDGCYPQGRTLTKAGGDIFDQSVSNIEDNRLRSVTSITNIDANNMHFNNYPNPFDDFTNIKYTLDKPAKVTLELFNSLGKTITLLVSQFQEAGNHKFTLDSKKLQLADGVYTLKLFAGNKVSYIKLIKTE